MTQTRSLCGSARRRGRSPLQDLDLHVARPDLGAQAHEVASIVRSETLLLPSSMSAWRVPFRRYDSV
jgi:hypothetical protein